MNVLVAGASGSTGSRLVTELTSRGHLKPSGIPYSILRPVSLTAEDGTHGMRFGDDVDAGATAARGDVASVLADAVDDEHWAGRVLLMQSA